MKCEFCGGISVETEFREIFTKKHFFKNQCLDCHRTSSEKIPSEDRAAQAPENNNKS